MRTGQVASAVLAVGIVGALLLAAAPSASACALTNPAGCASEVAISARKLVMLKVSQAQQEAKGAAEDADAEAKLAEAQQQANGAKDGALAAADQARSDSEQAAGDAADAAGAAAAGAQSDAENRSNAVDQWKGETLGHQTGCVATPPPVPPVIQGGPDVQGAIDSNLAYAEAQRQLTEQFVQNFPNDPFVVTAYTLDTGFENTAAVIASWDTHVFDPLTAKLQASSEDLPPDGPTTSFPQAELEAFVSAFLNGTSTQAACHADVHLPL